MTIRLKKAHIILLLFIGGCASTWPAPGTLSDGAQSVAVPSEFWGDHVFVEARFDSSDVRYMLLDTGFTFTVIDFKKAESLQMAANGESHLTGIGLENRVGMISGSPVQIQLTGIEPYERTIPVANLSEMSPFLGRNLYGVIGSDLFFRFVVEIDYVKNTVTLFDRRSYIPDSESIAIPITIRQNLPYLEASLRISDEMEIIGDFMIDTGSGGSIMLNSPFIDLHNLMETIPYLTSTISVGIGGALNLSTGVLNRLTIGSLTLENVPVRLSSAESGATSRTNHAGLIGNEVLKRFKVSFDYKNGIMYLKKQEDFSAPFSNSYSGLSLKSELPDFDKFTVFHIAGDSPASRADIQIGDKLISVEGKHASLFTMPEMREIFNSSPGTVLQLEVKRGEQILLRKLAIERLH